jgi:hypothetical protein
MRKSVATLMGSVMLYSGIAYSAEMTISINDIIANDHIAGTVTGLDAAEAVNYCVVVYIHTDTWYIHPFANGGVGKSWAEIRDGKAWRISTVKRDFPADSMAAVLLKRSAKDECSAPTKPDTVESIPREESMTIKRLAGTEDFKKL